MEQDRLDAEAGERGNGGGNQKNAASGLGFAVFDDGAGIAAQTACPIAGGQVAQTRGDPGVFVTGGVVSRVDLPLVSGIGCDRRIGTPIGADGSGAGGGCCDVYSAQ